MFLGHRVDTGPAPWRDRPAGGAVDGQQRALLAAEEALAAIDLRDFWPRLHRRSTAPRGAADGSMSPALHPTAPRPLGRVSSGHAAAGPMSTAMARHRPCRNRATDSTERVTWPATIAVQMPPAVSAPDACRTVQIPTGTAICDTREM